MRLFSVSAKVAHGDGSCRGLYRGSTCATARYRPLVQTDMPYRVLEPGSACTTLAKTAQPPLSALQCNSLTDSEMLKVLPLPEGSRTLRYSLSDCELHCKGAPPRSLRPAPPPSSLRPVPSAERPVERPNRFTL